MRKLSVILIMVLALTFCGCDVTVDNKDKEADASVSNTEVKNTEVTQENVALDLSGKDNETQNKASEYEFMLGNDESTSRYMSVDDTIGEWKLTSLNVDERDTEQTPWVDATFKGKVEIEGYLSSFTNDLTGESSALQFDVQDVSKLPICTNDIRVKWAQVISDSDNLRKQLHIEKDDNNFNIKVKAFVTCWNIAYKPMESCDTVEILSVTPINNN